MAHILVLEDDLALSAGLCFELDACGHLTVAAYHCEKARQLLEKEAFDLALFDVNLPDGSGFDLCREVKEKYPNLPVLFLTANDLEEDVLKGFDLGADDYITKPFRLPILKKRVEVALRRGTPRTKGTGRGMTTVSSAWTSPPSPPFGAGRCCPSPPTSISCSGSSPAARGRWSPAASCWKSCGTRTATSLMTTPSPSL